MLFFFFQKKVFYFAFVPLLVRGREKYNETNFVGFTSSKRKKFFHPQVNCFQNTLSLQLLILLYVRYSPPLKARIKEILMEKSKQHVDGVYTSKLPQKFQTSGFFVMNISV